MSIFLNILSELYSFFASLHKYSYNKGLFSKIKINSKIISIGNISVGGTGKTPFVIYISRLLTECGLRVVIVSRGYNRKSDKPLIIKQDTLVDVNEAGDEVAVIKNNLPGVEIVVDNSKSNAALIAEETFQPDVIIVDDGFQHHRLERDLDIVIIDKRTIESPNKTIPLTMLREKKETLNRAGLLVYRDTDKIIENINVPCIRIKSLNNRYINVENQNEIIPDNLPKSILVCGLAQNHNFVENVKKLKIEFPAVFEFNDHYNYSNTDVDKIIGKCNELNVKSILTTEKDYVKLKKFSSKFAIENIIIYINLLEFQIIEGKDVLHEKLSSLNINVNPDCI